MHKDSWCTATPMQKEQAYPCHESAGSWSGQHHHVDSQDSTSHTTRRQFSRATQTPATPLFLNPGQQGHGHSITKNAFKVVAHLQLMFSLWSRAWTGMGKACQVWWSRARCDRFILEENAVFLKPFLFGVSIILGAAVLELLRSPGWRIVARHEKKWNNLQDGWLIPRRGPDIGMDIAATSLRRLMGDDDFGNLIWTIWCPLCPSNFDDGLFWERSKWCLQCDAHPDLARNMTRV